MNAPLRRAWTQAEFFAWAEVQETRYEFDGVGPVAMTGGTNRHNVIAGNIFAGLMAQLRGTACHPFIFNAGVETIRGAVRHPDVAINDGPFAESARVLPNPVIVFEVISPFSNRMDRIVKVREYAAVPTILRYLIVETVTHGLTVLSRAKGDASWTSIDVTEEGTLDLPEAATTLAVAEIYAGLTVPSGQEE